MSILKGTIHKNIHEMVFCMPPLQYSVVQEQIVSPEVKSVVKMPLQGRRLLQSARKKIASTFLNSDSPDSWLNEHLSVPKSITVTRYALSVTGNRF